MQIKKLLAILLALALAVTSLTCLTALAKTQNEIDGTVWMNLDFEDSGTMTAAQDKVSGTALVISDTAIAGFDGVTIGNGALNSGYYKYGTYNGYAGRHWYSFLALDYNPLAQAGRNLTISMDVVVNNWASHSGARYNVNLLSYTGSTANSDSVFAIRLNSSGLVAIRFKEGTYTATSGGLEETDAPQTMHIEIAQIVSDLGNTITQYWVNGEMTYTSSNVPSLYTKATKAVASTGRYAIGYPLIDDGYFLDGSIDNVVIRSGADIITYDTDAVAAAEALVDNLGEITYPDSKEALTAARQAYTDLGVAEKYNYSKLAALEAAEAEYTELQKAVSVIDGKALEFTFDGDSPLSDTHGRVDLSILKEEDCKVEDGKLVLSPRAFYSGWWTRANEFSQTDYDPIRMAGKDLTIRTIFSLEEDVASGSQFNTTIFAYQGSTGNCIAARFSGAGLLYVRATLDGVETNLYAGGSDGGQNYGDETYENTLVGKGNVQMDVTQRVQEDGTILTQILLDGTVVAASTAVNSFYDVVQAGSTKSSPTYSIGSQNYDGGRTLGGSIDYFAIYNYDITDAPAAPIAYACNSAGAALSDGAADQYDITWNMELLDQLAGDQFATFNGTYTVVDYGVIVTAAEDAMDTYGKLLAESEDTAAKVDGKAYKTSFGQTAYSHFAYRRTNVKAGATRCTQFYLTYADADGNTYTVLSGVNQQLAQ